MVVHFVRHGEAEQPSRLGEVLRPALALMVHHAEVELRQGVALLGGFPGGVKAGFEEKAGDS